MPTNNIVEANFTPFWEGSMANATAIAERSKTVMRTGWKIWNGNCPIESTLQKYTESSNPKAVMEQGD